MAPTSDADPTVSALPVSGYGSSPSGGGQPDLDALIGDIRKEAARRRAAPDFPLDEEARLAEEMDRQAPRGGTADLAALLTALGGPGAGPAPTGPEVGPIAASTIRALAVRVSDLERRVDRLAPTLPEAPHLTAEPAGAPDLEHWFPEVRDLAGARKGRVLVAGPGAAKWTAGLAAAGADVYGVDPDREAYDEGGQVRSGGVAAHLQTVGEGALALTALVGPLAVAELPHLERWASVLAVRSAIVVVVSEAPWAWRLRLGDPAADTSQWRPAAPETWMAVLHKAGYRLAGGYGPDARDYMVVASGGPEREPAGP